VSGTGGPYQPPILGPVVKLVDHRFALAPNLGPLGRWILLLLACTPSAVVGQERWIEEGRVSDGVDAPLRATMSQKLPLPQQIL
jgi:hypothetical protein